MNHKAIIIKSLAFGAGFGGAAALILVIAILHYVSPKKWDNKAIIANYDRTDTLANNKEYWNYDVPRALAAGLSEEDIWDFLGGKGYSRKEINFLLGGGKGNKLVYYFILQNRSKNDFSVSGDFENNPIFFLFPNDVQISDSSRICWVDYQKPVFVPAGHKMRFAVHLNYPSYANNEIKRLEGFVMYDKINHFEIQLKLR